MLALYADIGDGHQNEGVALETIMRFEDQGTSHMTHLGVLKDTIDLAVDGRPGTGIVPFNGSFDADAIDGPEILNDLVNIASH